MSKHSSSSAPNDEQKSNWTKVLIEIIVKILTLGFYHIKKHKQNR